MEPNRLCIIRKDKQNGKILQLWFSKTNGLATVPPAQAISRCEASRFCKQLRIEEGNLAKILGRYVHRQNQKVDQ